MKPARTSLMPSTELLAPCGLDCSVCSRFLRWEQTFASPRRTGCSGCRIRDKHCAFLKGPCELLRGKKVEFCFECEVYPCERLTHLDKRYRERYGISPIQNLDKIRAGGAEAFLLQEQRQFGCPTCGGRISVHTTKCPACENSLRRKI